MAKFDRRRKKVGPTRLQNARQPKKREQCPCKGRSVYTTPPRQLNRATPRITNENSALARIRCTSPPRQLNRAPPRVTYPLPVKTQPKTRAFSMPSRPVHPVPPPCSMENHAAPYAIEYMASTTLSRHTLLLGLPRPHTLPRHVALLEQTAPAHTAPPLYSHPTMSETAHTAPHAPFNVSYLKELLFARREHKLEVAGPARANDQIPLLHLQRRRVHSSPVDRCIDPTRSTARAATEHDSIRDQGFRD